MKVIVPADTFETKKTIRENIPERPTYVRLGRSKVRMSLTVNKIKIGKASTLVDGGDTLISSGIMVSKSLEAAQMLRRAFLQGN